MQYRDYKTIKEQPYGMVFFIEPWWKRWAEPVAFFLVVCLILGIVWWFGFSNVCGTFPC